MFASFHTSSFVTFQDIFFHANEKIATGKSQNPNELKIFPEAGKIYFLYAKVAQAARL
jgi:hypothetical protein